MRTSKKYKTIDQYIADHPAGIKRMLLEIRKTIKDAVPHGDEVISYNIPAIKLHGVLVYYAAYKNHIGFYPTASGIKAFEKELSGYEGSKGAVRFPLDKPLPFDLIRKIVLFRVKEDMKKRKLK